MSDLFQASKAKPKREQQIPLPERLRPQTLDDIVGQPQLLGPSGQLTNLLKSGRLPSLILWGPPGCGKTTIARLLAEKVGLHYVTLSAVFSGVQDLKNAFAAARHRLDETGQGTLLFVDEIHRFNKAQQDAFLPVLEDGTLVLVGATTENPSFALNSALMSRAQTLVLERLPHDDMLALLDRAEAYMGKDLPLTAEARDKLADLADGDGRFLLQLADQLLGDDLETPLDTEGLFARIQKRAPLYDSNEEAHYNLISALHKSVRGSDVDAALYWFARMLNGGEDPRYIGRRMVRMAVEDIGLADPQALPICIAAWETYERLGSPEGELALAEALVYLATAPKSNATYMAFKAAKRLASETGSLMPPAHILNAPTKLMKEIGYGKGYQYDPDTKDGFSGQNYFPDGINRVQLYQPVERGFEREILKRLEYWNRLRSEKAAQGD
jgi:putative ATPase